MPPERPFAPERPFPPRAPWVRPLAPDDEPRDAADPLRAAGVRGVPFDEVDRDDDVDRDDVVDRAVDVPDDARPDPLPDRAAPPRLVAAVGPCPRCWPVERRPPEPWLPDRAPEDRDDEPVAPCFAPPCFAPLF